MNISFGVWHARTYERFKLGSTLINSFPDPHWGQLTYSRLIIRILYERICNITNYLQVDNISYRTVTDDLDTLFGKFGRIGDIYIPKDS